MSVKTIIGNAKLHGVVPVSNCHDTAAEAGQAPADGSHAGQRGLMCPWAAHPVYSRAVTRRSRPQPCRWCGRDVGDAGLGRRRQYCRQSCRQRAYEQRAQLSGAANGSSIPEDAVVLSAAEAAQLSDRVYQVRCAAEDVVTAVEEGADGAELRQLCEVLLSAAKAADGWR